ncbi:helix-turn-helix domain-containing protein [Aquimarina algiphila]|uniref:helix-turn-helix domain-containing protein n=1 Tax=Aquimarina algiphila TaxID=2047982 RepID=UPI00249173E2|nr:helix-turn-helix transcriptional regulator [Aquimarina algiphila]
MKKKLNITKTATRWKERAKKDRVNRRNISRAQAFALELMDYMEIHKIKQTELADKMEVTPQQVNKILRAKANLTFETLDKIADALKVDISTPKIKTTPRIYSHTTHQSMQIVHKRKHKRIEEKLTTKRITKRNPVMDTSIESMNSYNYTATQI